MNKLIYRLSDLKDITDKNEMNIFGFSCQLPDSLLGDWGVTVQYKNRVYTTFKNYNLLVDVCEFYCENEFNVPYEDESGEPVDIDNKFDTLKDSVMSPANQFEFLGSEW